MPDAAQVETPELDRRSKIIHSAVSPTDVLGEFYDWVQAQGYAICEQAETGRYVFGDSEPTREWVPLAKSPERLFADFFGIDLDKIEAERRALLDAIRQDDDKEG